MENKKEQKMNDLQLLWNITDLLHDSNDFAEVLDVALLQIMKAVHAEAATIWIIGESGEYIYPYLVAGPNASALKGMKLNRGEGMAGWVIENVTSQIVSDVKNDPRWSKRFDSSTGFVTSSLLCVPFAQAKGCIGCIQLINKVDATLFTSKDLELCENLGNLIGMALEKKKFIIPDLFEKEILIQLSNIKRNYIMGEVVVEALKNVSVDIYKGELIVILGASGSGKSTLLNILGGMDQPTAGHIMINNRDLSNAKDRDLTAYRKDEVGFVFQFYNLIPDLTAGENIALAAQLAKCPLTVEEVLKEVELLDKKNHFPSQMSGGEQQRISIARALIKKPSILLCDEPTGALDYKTGKVVLALIEKIARKMKNTVIIVTHNAAFAKIADRVIKMRNGEIEQIINNPLPISAERIDW